MKKKKKSREERISQNKVYRAARIWVYRKFTTSAFVIILGSPVDQSIRIDDKQLIVIDWYRPIDDQSIISRLSLQTANIDCRLLSSPVLRPVLLVAAHATVDVPGYFDHQCPFYC